MIYLNLQTLTQCYFFLKLTTLCNIKGEHYVSQKCTEGDIKSEIPARPDSNSTGSPHLSDERYGQALKFPLERANGITEIEIDFNHVDEPVQIAEVELKNSYCKLFSSL